MQERKLTFYIPGLFLPASIVSHIEQVSSFEQLALLLSRSSRHGNSVSSFDEGAFSLFGYLGVNGSFPVASVSRLVDAPDDIEGYWLRADPVCLQPNRDQVVMLGNSILNIRREEAAQIASEFNKLFAEDGLYLDAPTPDRWYLRCKTPPKLFTSPLEVVLGENIASYLPKGEDGLYWHKLLGEAQMLLYGSQVNQQRRESNEHEINSLWFWGGGCLPTLSLTQVTHVWANDVTLRGLADLHGISQDSLPESFVDWREISESAGGGSHLISFGGVQQALNERALHVWQDSISVFDSDWVRPALASMRKGELATLTLVTNGASFELTKKGLKRWWKRPRAFSEYVQ